MTRCRFWVGCGEALPPKVIAFSCQLLLDKVPTGANLVLQGVILGSDDVTCVLSGDSEESLLHLFLRFSFAQRVWYEVFR